MHPSDHPAHLEGRKSDFHAYACMEAIIVLFCSWTGSYRKPPARCSAVCWASHVLIETAVVQRRLLVTPNIAVLMGWQLQEIISAVQRGLLGLTCSN